MHQETGRLFYPACNKALYLEKEKWVLTLLQAVYHKGQQFVPETHARQEPTGVPDVLLAWIQALGALDQAQRIQQAVLHLLNTRAGHTQAKSAQVVWLPVLSMHNAEHVQPHVVLACMCTVDRDSSLRIKC